jgi:hypothetical protein
VCYISFAFTYVSQGNGIRINIHLASHGGMKIASMPPNSKGQNIYEMLAFILINLEAWT